MLPRAASAQATWLGNGADASWSTTGNWSSLASGFNTGLVFQGTNNLSNVNNFASGTATSITFASNAGAFTISGSALTLTGGITNNSSNLQSIANNVSTSAGLTVSGGTSVTLSGTLSASAFTTNLTNNLTSGVFTVGAYSGSTGLYETKVNGAGNFSFTGAIGGIGTSWQQNATGTTTFSGSSSSWNTSLSVFGGTVIFGGASGAKLGTGSVAISAGRLILDNTGSGNNNTNRLNDSAGITVSGGSFIFRGSDQAATNSTELVGAIATSPATGSGGTVTVSYGGDNLATLTAASFGYSPGAGTMLVNGLNLGKNSTDTGSVGKLIVTTAPTLVGTTAATTSGINSSVKNTQVVPHLRGESTATTGGLGSATGTANTFLTYNASTGLRPLNPTDEFTNNAITAGNNTYITAATTASTTGTINSLVINGGSLSIADSGTLTNASGAVLFASSHAIQPAGTTGAIAFANEAIVSVNAGVTGTIGARVVGTSAVTYSGVGTLVLAGSSSYTGATYVGPALTVVQQSQNAFGVGSVTLYGGTVQLGASSVMNSGSITAGPLGTGTVSLPLNTGFTVTLSGNDSSTKRTINNPFFMGASGATTGLVVGDGVNNASLEFAGNIVNSGQSRAITNNLSGAGVLTISGTLFLDSGSTGRTITLNGPGNTVLSGNVVPGVAGTTGGSLALAGTGTTTISGSNSYTAGTTLSGAGTVIIGRASAFGTGTVTTSAAVTLQAESDITNIANAFTVTNNPTFAGSSSIGLTGTLTNSGGNRTLTNSIASGKSLALGAVSLSEHATSGRTLTLAGTGNTTIGGVIFNGTSPTVGASSLTITNTGTTTLSAANTYTGATTLSGGVLAVSGVGTLGASGSSSIALSGGALNLGSTSQTVAGITVSAAPASGDAIYGGSLTGTSFSATLTSGTAVVSANILGSGTLGKSGAGVLVLSGSNTYTGATTISAGVVNLGSAETAGTSGPLGKSAASNPGSIVMTGGTLQYSAANQNDYSGRFSTAANQRYNVDTNGQNVTWATALTSSSSSLTKSGNGVLTLSVANTYTGTTTLSGGVINLGSAENPGVSGPLGQSAASNPGSIVMTGGTLQYSAVNQNDYSGRLNSSSTQYNVDTNGQNVTWATALLNTGATLTKLGSGTLTLTGANTYNGATTISAGVLATTGSNRLADSTIVSVASGATFRIGGFDTVGGLTGAGTLDLNGNELRQGLTASGTFSGAIVGSGTFGVNAQTSSYFITGSSSFTGVADLRGGTIYVGDDSAFGTAQIKLSASTEVTLASANSSTRTLSNPFGAGSATFGTPTTGNLVFTGTMTGGNIGTATVNNSLTQFNRGWGDGTFARTKTGTGTLAIGGSSVYTGTTNVTAGTLQLGIGSTDGTLSLSSVITGSAGATFSVNRTNTVTQGVDFRNGIIGAINVAQVGSGTLVLGGTNTYTGTTSLAAGTLLINSGSALAGGGSITFTGGTLMYSAANQADYASRIVRSTSAISINTNGQNVSWSSPLANTNIGGLSKLGSGTLALLSASTYSGQTLVASGVLALGVNGSFVNSEMIVVGNAGSSGAVLDLTAKSNAFSLGSGQTLMGGGVVKLAADTVFTVSGTFSPGNSPGLFTYSSGTTVLAGTTLMEIYGTSRATSSSHGSGFYDAVNIVNDGTLHFGGNLTFEFSSLFDNNSTFDLFTPASGSFLTGNFTGVTVTGGFYSGLSWNQTGPVWKSSNTAGGQSLEFNATNGQLVIVPEPATMALAGIGLLLAGWAAARRHRWAS